MVGIAGAAAAAPARYPHPPLAHGSDPAMAAAEALWTAAEQERDVGRVSAAWEAAAGAFGAIADDAHANPAVRGEAAYAALLAWKNAMAVDVRVKERPEPEHVDQPPAPRPLDARSQAFVAAAKRALALAPTLPDAVEIQFLRANVLRRFGHLDEAEADFIDILEHHRGSDVAVYAANLLLDSLNRQQRYDEMIRWVDLLRDDAAFTKAHPELAETLLRLHQQRLRREAERIERAATASHDRAGYDRCGAAYDAASAAATSGDRGDEILYNAAICYERGGSARLAIERYLQIDTRFPRSPLRPRALARLASLYLRVGEVAASADVDERFASLFAREKEASDALWNAVGVRRAQGDTGAAARDTDLWLKAYGARRRDEAVDLRLALARDWLDAGKPARARPLLDAAVRGVHPGRATHRDDALAQALWDAACPVAPADGLCLRRGRPVRNAARAERARAFLRGVGSPRAARLLADGLLEATLAIAASPARRVVHWHERLADAGTRARDAYDAVLAGPDLDDDTHARALTGRGRTLHAMAASRPTLDADARADFLACTRVALDRMLPDRLPACDDGVRATGGTVDALRERLPRHPAGRPPAELEGPP